jgi:hypothetical protein
LSEIFNVMIMSIKGTKSLYTILKQSKKIHTAMSIPKPRQPVTIEVKEIPKRKPSSEWVKRIYDINLLSELELTEIYEVIKYQGFDRNEILAKLEEKITDPKIVVELILLCSLRGPRAAENVKLRNGRTPKTMGIPASDQKGTSNLSCSRISAATADLAAFYLKKFDVPKRILSSNLPAWLQFPTAGSIKMPDDLRQQHIQFSKEFSRIIGGEFNEQIYSQMMNNSYLDESLKLF